MSLLFPTFPAIPDFAEAPRQARAAVQDPAAFAPAESEVQFPETQPDRVFGMNFMLDTAAEIRELKQFFSRVGGRWGAFYLPSWRRDLDVTGGSGVTLSVSSISLGTNHGDHFSRTLFIYQDGVVHVTRWVRFTGTVFQLEHPLPFTVSPARCMAGFAHLSRFAEDKLSWSHLFTDCATLVTSFRASRFYATQGEVHTMTPIAIQDTLGFDRLTVTADELAPINHTIIYAQGADEVGGGDFPNHRWACFIPNGYTGRPTLFLTDGTVTQPDTSDGDPSVEFPLDIMTHWLAFAFNISGQEFIAYQDGDEIEIRWAGNTERWTGKNPVMAYNYWINTSLDADHADMICYYLKEAGTELYARYDSEDFAVEHVAAVLPVRCLELRGIAANKADLLLSDSYWRLCTLRQVFS